MFHLLLIYSVKKKEKKRQQVLSLVGLIAPSWPGQRYVVI